MNRPIWIGAAPKPKQDCEYKLFDQGNISTVRFENDRYSLIYDDQQALDSFAKSLISNLEIIKQIDVYGHTSASASDGYNLKLSKKRAQGVQKQLESAGIPSSLIQSFWQGENQLLDSAKGSIAAEKNRRVEIKVTFKECVN